MTTTTQLSQTLGLTRLRLSATLPSPLIYPNPPRKKGHAQSPALIYGQKAVTLKALSCRRTSITSEYGTASLKNNWTHQKQYINPVIQAARKLWEVYKPNKVVDQDQDHLTKHERWKKKAYGQKYAAGGDDFDNFIKECLSTPFATPVLI
jgi:hypothetical protein